MLWKGFLEQAVQIREMEVSDLKQVLRIECNSFSIPWSESCFLSELNNPHSILLVATREDREVLGYICASHVAEVAEIKDIAVREDIRRRGIGKALLKSALERLKTLGCKEVFLEVRVSNIAARRLYEAMGFKMVGLRRQYYVRPEEDAIIMKKTLFYSAKAGLS
jgi:ribosomal-protein-alanine N-acetyltransferase